MGAVRANQGARRADRWGLPWTVRSLADARRRPRRAGPRRRGDAAAVPPGRRERPVAGVRPGDARRAHADEHDDRGAQRRVRRQRGAGRRRRQPSTRPASTRSPIAWPRRPGCAPSATPRSSPMPIVPRSSSASAARSPRSARPARCSRRPPAPSYTPGRVDPPDRRHVRQVARLRPVVGSGRAQRRRWPRPRDSGSTTFSAPILRQPDGVVAVFVVQAAVPAGRDARDRRRSATPASSATSPPR